MVVGPEHRVDRVDVVGEQLLRARSGEVSTSSRSPASLSTMIETRVRRFFGSCGIALAPVVADPRHPGRGARAEHDQLHARRFREQARRSCAWSFPPAASRLDAAQAGDELARCRARRPARRSGRGAAPARGTGCRFRPAGGPSGTSAAISCSSLAFLKVTMPESEIVSPRSSTLRAKSAEAVKQWISAGKAPLLHLLGEDRGGVVLGIAGVDDERQTGLARYRDMRAEQRLLHRAVGLVVVVVEPGFADRRSPADARPPRAAPPRRDRRGCRPRAGGCRRWPRRRARARRWRPPGPIRSAGSRC